MLPSYIASSVAAFDEGFGIERRDDARQKDPRLGSDIK